MTKMICFRNRQCVVYDFSILFCRILPPILVWIAMALAQQPKLLVLDEPTTYLDINHQLEIMELLKRLNDEQGLTVLMVLHELTQAVQYSHYMAIIKDGHLVTAGDTKEIVSDELFRDVFSVDVQIDTFDDKQYVRVKGLVE